jgi:cysteinyl-tRNA synthetase
MGRIILFMVALILSAIACNFPGLADDSELRGDAAGESASDRFDGEIPPRPVPQPAEPIEDKWELWTGGTRLRGVDLHPCRLFSEGGCAEPISRQDVQDVRNLGANLINASYPGLFTIEPPFREDPTAIEYLDNLVTWSEEVGIFVVIHFRTGPGRNGAAIVLEGDPVFDVWTDQAAHDAWIEMWRFTAERYRDSPVVAGYDLMVEPHPNTLLDPDGESDPQSVQEEMDNTLLDWNVFAREITDNIREIDPETPIIVNSLNWGSAAWFPVLEPTGDSRTAYSLHAYDPDVYVLQEEGESSFHYPDEVEDYGETIIFDKEWLNENYHPVRQFAEQYNVPIYVGEFGALRWVPNAVDYLRDQMDLFEAYGWNYAVYVWRGDEPGFDGFNVEYGPNPDSHEQDLNNDLLRIFLENWALNVDFPFNQEPAGVEIQESDVLLPALESVRTWLYLIDVDLESDTVDQIIASDYDMVVLDFIPSEENNTDYPMAEVIDRLHNLPQPKLVVAYIDIGEAEEYRTYWQPGWGIGDPEWIAGDDPDGWEGNYPVAYWWDEWQHIWTGPDGYLQAIIDDGFNGLYLDWVEAYSDENVAEFARSDGVDARQEMIHWVGDIAEFGRDRNPGFVVIAQNAAELLESDEYVAMIDAIAQEQVWYDGGADNDPPGDCPLPRTGADVDTEAYRQSLTPGCQRQYDEYPESTLHVSSDEYLLNLRTAKSMGLPVFTVDYALNPDNVDWIYETSRGLGFIPFVGNRALDEFVEPYDS